MRILRPPEDVNLYDTPKKKALIAAILSCFFGLMIVYINPDSIWLRRIGVGMMVGGFLYAALNKLLFVGFKRW